MCTHYTYKYLVIILNSYTNTRVTQYLAERKQNSIFHLKWQLQRRSASSQTLAQDLSHTHCSRASISTDYGGSSDSLPGVLRAMKSPNDGWNGHHIFCWMMFYAESLLNVYSKRAGKVVPLTSQNASAPNCPWNFSCQFISRTCMLSGLPNGQNSSDPGQQQCRK